MPHLPLGMPWSVLLQIASNFAFFALGLYLQWWHTRNTRKLSLRVAVGGTIPIGNTTFELAPGDTIVVYGSHQKR